MCASQDDYECRPNKTANKLKMFMIYFFLNKMSVVLKNHFVNDNVVPQCQKFGLAYKDIKEVSTLTGFPLCRISLNKKKKKIGKSMRLPCLAVPLNSWHSTC